MSSRAAATRVLVLTGVAAIHAGALLLLLAETRTRLMRGVAETRSLLVTLPPREPRQPARSARAEMRLPIGHLASPTQAASEVAPPAGPAAPAPTAIDWAAEASVSAARQIETDEQRARQARALAPKASPMFAPRPKRPEFPWNYASTHRVEALPGLGTVIHLNDQCAIVLFVIIPIGGGCALGKPPVRGDLFEHLHDPVDPD